MSQLLFRIDAQLAVVTDPYVAAELTSQKAAYLARVGRFAEARLLIGDVRTVFSDGRSGRVTCLLMVAEAMLLHFESISDAAQDRLARALLIAQGIRDPEMICLTAVWKAFVDFEFSRFESMRRALEIARTSASEADHGPQARYALIMMLGAQLLGRREQGRVWFGSAHRHAIAAGDQASIDALIFNQAAFGLARQRINWCRGAVDQDWLNQSRSELGSARNLESMVGISSLVEHVDLALARADTARGEFAAAIDALEAIRSSQAFAAKHSNSSALSLEIGYCYFKLGQSGLARTLVSGLDEGLLDQLDPDERVVLLTMWVSLAEAGLAGVEEGRIRDRLLEATSDYAEYESRLEAAFNSLL